MSNTDTSRVDASDVPSAVQSSLGSIARAGLAAVGGILVHHGLISDAQEQSFVAAGAGVVLWAATIAWAWFKNRKARSLTVAALNSPAPRVPAQ